MRMRLGPVISTKDGALAKMLPVFKLGLGGKIGSGKQIFSWIALDEIPLIILHLIESSKISGPVNLVSPYPVNNEEFTKTLGKVIHRPTIFPVPSFGIRLMFGEMGETLISGGARILPNRLKEYNYQFQYPRLEEALKHCLK